MDFYQDEISFTAPMKAAFGQVEAELQAAGLQVAGAFGRADAADRAKRTLHEFKNRLAGHIRAGNFASLPRLRSWLMPIPDCHHLTVGEWRGVFLVSREADAAVAILFSRRPHDLSGRLQEAIERNRPRLEPSDDSDENNDNDEMEPRE